VEQSSALADGWTNVGPVVTGTLSGVQVTWPDAATSRFFRVRRSN
jgi:hypothetical protein